MCGEKFLQTTKQAASGGSPPRVRGKESPSPTANPPTRITPACAGKRHYFRHAKYFDKDHPRVCGEKKPPDWGAAAESGSPPRVRGKAWAEFQELMHARITPACAGKRNTLEAVEVLPEDHPRVCGEKPVGVDQLSIRIGSPPRVRGKGFAATATGNLARITPACAGKRRRYS